jgi:hypothetical protein
MTEQSPGRGRSDDWSRDGYVAGEQYHGAGDQYRGASQQYRDPSQQYRDPSQQYRDPSQQYRDPSEQYRDPSEQYRDPTEQFYAPGESYYGAGTADPGTAGPGNDPPTAAIRPSPPRQAADSKGFLSALFDFSFTSFVTTRIIKVLYVLIMILTILSALVFTVSAFNVTATFGFLTLIIGAPLFILVVMAFWRLILEAFIVVFRIADDLRELRDRGESR